PPRGAPAPGWSARGIDGGRFNGQRFGKAFWQGTIMRIADMDWRMVEDWVRHDDRCILPIGSTEQHAGLSLATDAINAERVSTEAAEPLGVPVFPALPYGLTPYFTAFPGTITLRVATYAAVVRDVL